MPWNFMRTILMSWLPYNYKFTNICSLVSRIRYGLWYKIRMNRFITKLYKNSCAFPNSLPFKRKTKHKGITEVTFPSRSQFIITLYCWIWNQSWLLNIATCCHFQIFHNKPFVLFYSTIPYSKFPYQAAHCIIKEKMLFTRSSFIT